MLIAEAKFYISKTLLHDVILLEVRAFMMKYQANKRRMEKEKTDLLESEIDKLQNSQEEEDIEQVNNMKKELQDIEDERDMMNARYCEKPVGRREADKVLLLDEL